jgi:hypothetical protein
LPKAFIPGVPETSALWRTVVEQLEGRGIVDVTLLSPPGFGAPELPGWVPKEAGQKWPV